MKLLIYELIVVGIGVPFMFVWLVLPLLTMASTIGNLAGMLIMVVVAVEGLSLVKRIINKIDERTEL